MTSKEAERFLARATEEGAWFSLVDDQGELFGRDIVDHAEVLESDGRDLLNVRLAGYERDAHLNHLAQVTSWEEGWDTFVLDGSFASGQKFRFEIIDRASEPGLYARLQEWRWMQRTNPDLYRTAGQRALQEAREMANANSGR